MPYIKKENRVKFEASFKALPEIDDPGELNFLMTRIIQEYARGKVVNYKLYNEVIGCLECVKTELYRRKIADYEMAKIEENSDVY